MSDELVFLSILSGRVDMSVETVQLNPEPSILIESLRDIGYSFNSALADIVDNSITANATKVWIQAIPDDEFRDTTVRRRH